MKLGDYTQQASAYILLSVLFFDSSNSDLLIFSFSSLCLEPNLWNYFPASGNVPYVPPWWYHLWLLCAQSSWVSPTMELIVRQIFTIHISTQLKQVRKLGPKDMAHHSWHILKNLVLKKIDGVLIIQFKQKNHKYFCIYTGMITFWIFSFYLFCCNYHQWDLPSQPASRSCHPNLCLLSTSICRPRSKET